MNKPILPIGIGVPLLQSPQSGEFNRARILQVVAHPHPTLAKRAVEVDPHDPAVVALANALTLTMRVSPACVGLAAPQVGEPLRLFCMDVTGHPKARSCAGLVVMANPYIVARGPGVIMREGCMSVPHLTGNVSRAKTVTVEGVEPGTGRLLRVTADGIEARCLQHEIDHLEGFLFVDRVGDKAKDVFARKTYVE